MAVKRSRAARRCGRCEEQSTTLFRVQVEKSSDWRLLCAGCVEAVRPGNPAYRYGGTWKADKRH